MVSLKAGDVAILPAGTGHQCLGASDDFLDGAVYRDRRQCATALGGEMLPGAMRRVRPRHVMGRKIKGRRRRAPP
jgi:uncharacterized protein YjlB